jgi:ADP-ribosylglycohydrolase
MTLPADYTERVYAGVLGKLIGVYLGRPFEGWLYEHIMEYLGEINYYVHEKLDVPLIVTDDDISGTFTFLRALPDYGNRRDLTPAQIGHTWLNYIIEEQTVLWWGGMGNSTEHTAFLRLKSGIEAPRSGSIALNSKVVAEQIGSQIFIDGWAMVAPGDPELAADLARRAASVSHDGEAIYGAQVVAAMEALAFVESDLNKLIDTAVTFIPRYSIIHRLIDDIRGWHAKEKDWRKTREQIVQHYGYDQYGGNCHMVPNHALIIHALLHGEDDFQKSLMIVNTSGWDTDCNSGNVGCLLGIKNGLAGLHTGPDWRGPVADRMYLPTADGGRAITDAVSESLRVVNIGRALQNQPPIVPKNGARYHFDLPGAVQGFMAEDSIEVRGTVAVENVTGHSLSGERALALRYRGLAPGRVARVETATFVPSDEIARYFARRGYRLLASPAIYSGQTLRARVVADSGNAAPAHVRLYVKHYDHQDHLAALRSDAVALAAGAAHEFVWTVPDTVGYPIAFVGVEISGAHGASGTVYLDYLTWDGTPRIVLQRPYERKSGRAHRGQEPTMWKRAWVDGFDSRERLSEFDYWPEPYRLIQNRGRGLLMHGTREWTDYQVTAQMTPHMCKAGGIGVRVQGMQRYYALLCDADKTRLVRAFEGHDTVLAEAEGGWRMGVPCELRLQVVGNRLVGWVNGKQVVAAADPDGLFSGGAIALIAEEGRIGCDRVEVGPVQG